MKFFGKGLIVGFSVALILAIAHSVERRVVLT